ncbi:hypothetical protein A6V27_00005 [Hafnia alvei]|uniref:DUF4435 domain-containing protein n=1 Tax=Hafnia alvei TaxID=569 RepID=UPI0007BCA219|nr:DUF4435 domain-containing protein [Hafnia alvei]ANC42609.1 hypothetical protein A6V27_00005 [Hafnia alvei]
MEVNSLGFKSKSSYYEKSARFLDGNQPKWVAVWVESDDDKKLWLPVLKNTFKKFNFKFHIASLQKFEDGKIADGCSRIFAKINTGEIVLGKCTIACLDSDYSYISGNYACKQKDLLGSSFVFQTYAHSKENIYVHPHGIAQIFEYALGEDLEQLGLNVESFSKNLSVSIHKYLVKLISLYQFNDIKEFDKYHKRFISDFKSILNDIKLPEDLSSNFERILEEKFDDFDKELTHYIEGSHGGKIIDATVERFKEINVLPTDSLNFIRGHDLYPVMMKIYKSIDQYIFKIKREQYNQEHIPEEVRKKKNCEMGNKRVSIEDVICTRNDVKNNQYFSRAVERLSVLFS